MLWCFSCNWLRSLAAGKVVALYCADVEGAFDRVDAGRLVSKLANFGISGPLLDVMRDWLSVGHGCVAGLDAATAQLLLPQRLTAK